MMMTNCSDVSITYISGEATSGVRYSLKALLYELTDKVYQACRQHFGSKKHLWENVRANLRTFIFTSWDYLLAFTLDPEKYITDELPAPS